MILKTMGTMIQCAKIHYLLSDFMCVCVVAMKIDLIIWM